MILPLVKPYVSIAYVFIQLQEQNLPETINLFRLSSCLVGIDNGSLSKS
jgi:hypothetical protein